MTTTEQSARSRIRQWALTHIEGQEEVQVPVLVDEAIASLGKDRKLIAELGRESLREIMYRQLISAISSTRNFVTTGDVALTVGGVKEKARRHSVFASWLEHVGDHHVRLMDATREDLLLAADEREKRGNTELGIARLWRTVANGLEGGQTVGSKYSAEEIESMHRGLEHA